MSTGQVRTASAEETQRCGQLLGQALSPGMVVGLEGDLGAGKTCFVRGVAVGLGIHEDEVSSPTFAIIAEYSGGRLPLYHIDLYRVEGTPLDELGLEEYVFGNGVAVIEWFRFFPVGLVDEYLLVSFTVERETERLLTLTAYGAAYDDMVKHLQSQWN